MRARKGYVILVWDGWVETGEDLTLLQPRLHSDSVNRHNDPINWWPHYLGDKRTDKEILSDHRLTEDEDLYFKVVHVDFVRKTSLTLKRI